MKNVPPSGKSPQAEATSMTKAEIKDYLMRELKATGEIYATVSDREMMDTITTISGKKMLRLYGMMKCP